MNNTKINTLYYYIDTKDITDADKKEALERLKKIPNVSTYDRMSDAEQRLHQDTYISDGIWSDISRLISYVHELNEVSLMISFNSWMKEGYEKLILELFDNIKLYTLYTYNNSLHISEVKLNEDDDVPIIYEEIEVTREMMMFMIKMTI